jgi:hypothetical protein
MTKLKISLDDDIFAKLKTLSSQAGYSSTEEFIQHLIEKEVSVLNEAASDDELKKRLQGLGYIS